MTFMSMKETERWDDSSGTKQIVKEHFPNLWEKLHPQIQKQTTHNYPNPNKPPTHHIKFSKKIFFQKVITGILKATKGKNSKL